MQIQARTDYAKLVHSRQNIVNLMLSLTAPEPSSEDKRNPLALALVIDRSGSMGWPSSQQGMTKLDHVKKSAYKLIENLSENDSLALVSFDTAVMSVAFERMTSGGKEKLKKEVANIQPGGGTDIGAALRAAIEMFANFEGPGNCIDRIMLLTDGQANNGAQKIEQFVAILDKRRGGVGVSCFGYGTEYNENLLAGISEHGKGGNYFIESPDNCSQAFAVELGGLLTCYAQKVVASIRTHKGAAVTDVLNDFNVKTRQDGDGDLVTDIEVDDLYCGETRHVVVRISCDIRPKPLPRAQTVADVSVSYVKLEDGTDMNAEEKVKIEFVRTSDAADSEADKVVVEQVALLEAAHIQVKAKKMADDGQWAEANVLCKQSADSLRAIGSEAAICFASAVDEVADGYNVSYSSDSRGAKSASNLGTSMLRSRASSYAGGEGALAKMACFTSSIKEMVDKFSAGDNDPVDNSVSIGTSTGSHLVSNTGYVKNRVSK